MKATIRKYKFMNDKIMKDKIIFEYEKQAREFESEHLMYNFSCDGKVVTGAFSEVCLRGTNFRNADLTGVNLNNSTIKWSNFSGANLTGANLSYSSLQRVDLIRANLTGANLEGAWLQKANLSHANVSGTPILSIPAIGLASYNEHIYATLVYSPSFTGQRLGWGFHAGWFYGSYSDTHEAILRKYGEGEYSNCLDKLQSQCMTVFNPLKENSYVIPNRF